MGTVHDLINSELVKINEWITTNKLSVNLTKTKYIVFSYRGEKELSVVRLGRGEVFINCTAKFLGLGLDARLSFSKHISNISSKISKNVGILYKMSRFLPHRALLNIYYALIHPYFYYAIDIYFNTSDQYINNLVTLQKRAIRAVNKLSFCEHTNNYFHSCNILKLSDLHKFATSVYFYKAFNLNYDDEMLRFLNLHSNIHTNTTRNRESLVLLLYRRSTSQNSIIFIGSKIWNDLPLYISNSGNLQNFKANFKKCYLLLYVNSDEL